MFCLTACTSESTQPENLSGNEITNAKSGKSLSQNDFATAVNMFKQIIKSNEYTDYHASLKTFNAKLGYQRVGFATKREWTDWASKNISSTTFTNVAQLENMYDDSFNKLNIVVTKYNQFYTLLGNASLSQIHTIFEPLRKLNQINYPVTTSACEDDCHGIAAGGFGYAYDQRSSLISIGQNSSDPVTYFFMIQWADQIYLQETNCIVYELNACIGAC